MSLVFESNKLLQSNTEGMHCVHLAPPPVHIIIILIGIMFEYFQYKLLGIETENMH